jgi:hypothetical protein
LTTTVIATFFLIKFGKTILSYQDSLEDALEVIDEKYGNISAVCERPLFYDSPEVREVLNDIKATRDSLHQVAFSLTENFSIEEEHER